MSFKELTMIRMAARFVWIILISVEKATVDELSYIDNLRKTQNNVYQTYIQVDTYDCMRC